MSKARARDLRIPFTGQPGPHNGITDVPGLEVGTATLIEGKSVRTGVTAILPCGQFAALSEIPAALFSLNGNGEMTGSHWLEESGLLTGPVVLTNTHSIGAAHEGTCRWLLARDTEASKRFLLPVIAETYDGVLNDINGFHIRPEHAQAALDAARSGPVEEGNVGGGTGMITHQFKGGNGTSSRQVDIGEDCYTLGCFVQSNYGLREQLLIAGIPVGQELTDLMPEEKSRADGTGSIIVVIATDAPLLAHQCKRLARRVSMGLARLGSVANNGSGDIFIAFSTASQTSPPLDNDSMNALFQATVEATEEAIVNALVAAETMTGLNGTTIHALPHNRLCEILKRHNRIMSAALYG
ncbi:P1 family peptidase [Kiloniella laminariae]|uniref:DmpA family aminopeptidase n=1 Tax=Kiloniella laminariae TaxID=454162 RepID=UPI00036389D9|nr:P1 family peptidase [Kiloniella laminariae]